MALRTVLLALALCGVSLGAAIGKYTIDALFAYDVQQQHEAYANNTTANNLTGRLRSAK